MNVLVLFSAFCALALAAPSNDRKVEEKIDIGEWERNGTYPYRPTIGGRIVGGTATTISSHPWQAAVLRNNEQICGGAIVAPRVILTAAHCVAPSVIPYLSLLSVRVGATYHNSGGLVVAPSRLVVHANFQDCKNCSPDYDIAVIHLNADAVVYGIISAAIPLWDANVVFNAGTFGTVSGWGRTTENGTGSLQLRKVDVPIISEANCRYSYGDLISSRTICAGFAAGGQDPCRGDSGGPYVIQDTLAGLVSFGIGCARPGFPGVYSSIPGYRDWIATNAGI